MFCNVCLISCRCECSEGYARDSASRTCLPQCRQSCVHGTCVAPDVCLCTFGHVGRSCEHTCLCNGHSNCQVSVFTLKGFRARICKRLWSPGTHSPTLIRRVGGWDFQHRVFFSIDQWPFVSLLSLCWRRRMLPRNALWSVTYEDDLSQLRNHAVRLFHNVMKRS